jgi:hypothetical protein
MNTRSTTIAERFAALALALLFLLQSAAQAGSGCLSWAVSGRCCCESVDRPEVQSCCSARVVRDVASGPVVAPPSACRCELAPLPATDAVEVHAVAGSSHGTNDAFATWIAHHAPVIEVRAPAIAASPPEVVPRRPVERAPCTFASLRLASRGVSAFLSELGFLLR